MELPEGDVMSTMLSLTAFFGSNESINVCSSVFVMYAFNRWYVIVSFPAITFSVMASSCFLVKFGAVVIREIPPITTLIAA
jgi:hypothetical protein